MLRYRLGAPPPTLEENAAEWHHLSVFGERPFFISVGLGISIAGIFALLWTLALPGSLPLGSPSFPELIAALLILVVGHESCHLAGFPKLGFDGNAVAGIWVERGSPYALYRLPLKRNRFLWVLLLPFLVISFGPLLIAFFGGSPPPLLQWCSVLNAFGAASDMYVFFTLIRHVPSDGVVIENGNNMSWRTAP